MLRLVLLEDIPQRLIVVGGHTVVSPDSDRAIRIETVGFDTEFHLTAVQFAYMIFQ